MQKLTFSKAIWQTPPSSRSNLRKPPQKLFECYVEMLPKSFESEGNSNLEEHLLGTGSK